MRLCCKALVAAFSFGPESRINLDRDVERVLHEGRRVNEDFITLFWLKREIPPSENRQHFSQRLAIRISSRVGDAVFRNRLKRLIREVFRHERSHWENNIDVVMIVKPAENLKKMDYGVLRETVMSCCRKAGMMGK